MRTLSLNHKNFPTMLGFKDLIDEMDRFANSTTTSTSYPPYNVVETSENEYTIEVAVAGFAQDDLTIEEHNGQLTIRGEISDDTDRKYVHKGISTRRFERVFTIADHVHVSDAVVENGLLSVHLVREVPEELQPRKIAIEFKK